ncbi:hypothetical protein DL766_009179 [Monosporascus sp. MC13-8B]|uniref:J domain-containing protein n=1 Tax=Monosporascus cannonballus TaxID=155416 RepID=A0ABY0H8H3_9PEZI|nr:hypothetical protein DL762_004149 [Monosporascus cannonballus]RYO97089.1 hypothetical protein DL763_002879 [Monosporascus cannonballus]RYP16255.1 hypothetical protein DL766_009179 [Monosporascus sp. MC13-8B]
MSSVGSTWQSTTKEPWLAFIGNEFDIEGYSTRVKLLIIIRDTLLSIGEAAAKDGAHRIDSYYSDTSLSFDPLVKFAEDKGMAGFLNALWDAVFDSAELLPFDDPKQDRLVAVILELRKLPPKLFKIWQSNRLVYIEEPIFFMVQKDRWNGSFPRCTEAGIDTEPLCKHPGYEIVNGLEKDYPLKVERDCKVMVAAQYILLAGRALHETFITRELSTGGEEAARWGLEKWRLWAARLKAIEEKGDCDPKVIAAVVEARRRLIALHPGVFRDSVAKLMRKKLTAPHPDLSPGSPTKRARKRLNALHPNLAPDFCGETEKYYG